MTRVEPVGAFRTPRSEIVRTRREGKLYEPRLALDLSPSMFWSARDENNQSEEYPSPFSRRKIVEGFLPLYVAHLAGQDSKAKFEQGNGGDELGGVMTVGFSGITVKIGDLNESNYLRKMEAAWKAAAQKGGTVLAGALGLLIDMFNEEFKQPPRKGAGHYPTPVIDLTAGHSYEEEDDEDQGDEEPRVDEISLITDGEPSDPDALIPYLHEANEWRKFLVGIVGHGAAAKKTADLYGRAADENEKRTGETNIHVINFDGETDPGTVASEMILMAS